MNRQDKYNILKIIRGTTVDGPGFRTSIYMAGCIHHCPGCHNPQSWDFNGGNEMDLQEIMKVVNEEDFDVTLTGGDPLCTPTRTLNLVKAIHSAGYGIWLYTGFRYEEILLREELKSILEYIDVIVDGPYIEELKNSDLQFRGSENQRIIKLK